ncbi:MAG TPA: 16S rRNA (guanine(966)-N(2))-methyltransferase RsmD [Myxococcota bacterium]|nr:16S rRNA (guanine(966)-N(2))-methyltransferase RsmD [Myxococcota bacterium]
MRVTGGRLGGRRLVAPPSGVRPTADRVREALFARLADLDGVCVLDLYAGTGALGIEALSRGAARAVFVERSNASLAALRRNLRTLELDDHARVVCGDVRGVLRRLAGEGMRFDLVLADPPYEDRALAAPLALLVSGGLLAPGATVVVERSRRHPLPPIEGLVSHGSRRYGDTELEWLGAGDPLSAGEGERDA